MGTFTHYAHCPRLWWEVHIFLCANCSHDLAFKIQTFGTSDSGLFSKLGLAADCYDDFLPIALAFGLYHGFKLHSKAQVRSYLAMDDAPGLKGLCFKHLRNIFSAHLRDAQFCNRTTGALPSEN